MRSTTHEEISRLCDELRAQPLRGGLHKEFLDMLGKKQLSVEICTVCGTWVAEIWNRRQARMSRQFIVSPFRFNIGDLVRVTLEGEHYGRDNNQTNTMIQNHNAATSTGESLLPCV